MAQFNKLILQCNLGSDPEFNKSTGGKPYARVSLANSQGSDEYNNKHTNWLDGVAFGRMAGVICGFTKGQQVLVTGKLETRSVPMKHPVTGEIIMNATTGKPYTVRKTSFVILTAEEYTSRKQIADAQQNQSKTDGAQPQAQEQPVPVPAGGAEPDPDEILDAITF